MIKKYIDSINKAITHDELIKIWTHFNTAAGDTMDLVSKNKATELKRWNKEFKGNLNKIKADLIK